MKTHSQLEVKGYGVYPLCDKEDKELLLNVDIVLLEKGNSYVVDEKLEKAILLLQGAVVLTCAENKVSFSRKSVFEEEASCLHGDKDSVVTCFAQEDSELLIQKIDNQNSFEMKVYNPEDIQVSIFGENEFDGTMHREVKTVFDYANAPYSNMVLGEVISRGGNWSSYPPHHHEQPEIYFYKYERPEGFGFISVGDDAYQVKNNSVIKILGGKNHPQATAPGFPMYFCWMIAHLENNPWTSRTVDERYLWQVNKKG